MNENTRSEPPVQLTLLGTSVLPARFRLSRDTRERGLRHIAEIRERLAEAPRPDENTQSGRPPRRAA